MNAHLYLDTCALVKAYIREAGSDDVRRWMLGAELHCSHIIHAELRAALSAKVRLKQIDEKARDQAMLAFKASCSAFNFVHVNEDLLIDAGNLTNISDLRSLDAIHLSSAISVRSRFPDVELVTFDTKLRAAATFKGFRLLPA